MTSRILGWVVVLTCLLAVPVGMYTLDVRDFAEPAFVHTDQLQTAASVRVDAESVRVVLDDGAVVQLQVKSFYPEGNEKCIQCEPDRHVMSATDRIIVMDTTTSQKVVVQNRRYRSFFGWTAQSWELTSVTVGLASGVLLGTTAGLAFSMRTPVYIAVGVVVAMLTLTRNTNHKAVNMYMTLLAACLAAACMVHPRGAAAQKVIVPLAVVIAVHMLQVFAFSDAAGVLTFTPWMLLAPILLGVLCAVAMWKLNTLPAYGRHPDKKWRTCSEYHQMRDRDDSHCPERRFPRRKAAAQTSDDAPLGYGDPGGEEYES